MARWVFLMLGFGLAIPALWFGGLAGLAGFVAGLCVSVAAILNPGGE